MINDIITGISKKLYELFGTNYKIYTEEVKQGLKEPCFLISHITSDLVPLLKTRKKLDNTFCITFIPDESNSKNENIYEVQLALLSDMEFITSLNGEMYHGTGMRTEMADGVLHCFVNYNFTINSNKDSDYMEKLQIKEAVGNGNGN